MYKFLCSGFFALAVVILFSFPVSRSFAQDTNETRTDGDVIATVNIYDTKIISQTENQIKLSFEIFNRENVQPDIHYGVFLFNQDSGTKYLVDRKNYDEVLTLGPGESQIKEIIYVAPAFLKGNFVLKVNAFTSDSLPLAFGDAGMITLDGSGQYVEILTESCFILVENEDPKVKYALSQGVDVEQSENLIGQCTVKNNYQSQITVTALFNNYYRTASGEKVDSEKYSPQTITLNPRETKDVSLLIPKALKPQAYDAELRLILGEQSVSNTIDFHYVLRGESATIHNLRTDKSYYTVGEDAIVSFNWVGSADLHSQARTKSISRSKNPTIRLTLQDGNNIACAKPIDAKSPENEADRLRQAVYHLSVTSDCIDPQVVFQIVGDQGTILAEKEVSIKSTDIPATISPVVAEKERSRNIVGWVATGIVFIIACVLIITILRKRRGRTIFSFLLVLCGMSISIREASADTLTTVVCFNEAIGGSLQCITVHAVVQIDKRTYFTNEPLKMTGTLQDAYCSNGVVFNGFIKSKNVPRERNYVFIGQNMAWGTSASRMSTAPGTAGVYRVKFKAKHHFLDNDTSDADSTSINYTVKLPFFCTGTLPTNATMFAGDNVGLSADTPYSHSLSDTAIKCQFSCNTDYAWNVDSKTCEPEPTVDLKINTSDGPLYITQGDVLDITWNATNATSCSAVSGTGFTNPLTSSSNGNQIITVNGASSDPYKISCTGPGGTASDSVDVTFVCPPLTYTDWSPCSKSCGGGTTTRTDTNCFGATQSQACNTQPCSTLNWQETTP